MTSRTFFHVGHRTFPTVTVVRIPPDLPKKAAAVKNDRPLCVLIVENNVAPRRSDVLAAELSRFDLNHPYRCVYLPRSFYVDIAHDVPRNAAGGLGARLFRKFQPRRWWGECRFLMSFFLAASRCDVIHVGGITIGLTYLALVCRRLFGVRVVQDTLASISLTDDEAAEGRPADRRRRRRAAAERRTLLSADRLIYLQAAEARAACERLGIDFPQHKVHVIPLAADDPAEVPAVDPAGNIPTDAAKWSADAAKRSADASTRSTDEQRSTTTPIGPDNPTDRFEIAWWASFSPLHGVPLVLDALQRWVDRRPEDRWKLTLFARSTHRIDLERLVDDSGLGSRVAIDRRWTLADPPLRRAVAVADLTLGQFGDSVKANHVITHKVLEALSFGRPVLTRGNAAYAERIPPGVLYESSGDPCDLARCFAEAFDDPDRAGRGRRGRRCFEQQFTVERLRSRYRDFYDSWRPAA